MEFVVFSNRHYVEIGKTQHAIKRENRGRGLSIAVYFPVPTWGGGAAALGI